MVTVKQGETTSGMNTGCIGYAVEDLRCYLEQRGTFGARSAKKVCEPKVSILLPLIYKQPE